VNLPYTLEKVVPGSASHVACRCFPVPVAQDGGNYCVTYTVPGTSFGMPFASIQMDPHGIFNGISDKNLLTLIPHAT